MITGFNTDIEHDGVVYHVQTEDKGLESPLILSLVYKGGTILASKRSRYEDLIADGFDEEVLAQRLKRQHRLICAAINAGRLEDLKRMGGKGQTGPLPADVVGKIVSVAQAPVVVEAEIPPPFEIVALSDEFQTTEWVPPPQPVVAEAAPEPAEEPVAEVVPVKKKARSRSTQESIDTVQDERPVETNADDGSFALSLLEEEEFRAGESYTIRVLVEDRSGRKRKPLGGVGVSLKILGTAFRPQIYSVKTERDGVAAVDASMPSFTSGRAAVLIRVVVKGEPREVRRVIHPAE